MTIQFKCTVGMDTTGRLDRVWMTNENLTGQS